MKAMQFRKPADLGTAPLSLCERPDPEPGPGEVRVRVRVCAVCRTDLHVIEGELRPKKSPLIPGHQIVGVVDALGPGASTLRIGARVGIAWLRETCRRCRFCNSGRENLCLGARFTGYDDDGGYATVAVAPVQFAYPIPEVFSDEEAAPLLCAGIIGYRALRLSGVRPGQRLGLYGFGAAAHLAIQVARHWDCEVYVCSLRPEHRRMALDMGARWAGEAAAMPPDLLHASIMFAPAGELVAPALRALDRGGTLALAGIHMSPIPSLNYDEEVFGERVIRSVTANTRQDGMDFLDVAARIPIRPQTVRFRLDQANEALQALKAGSINGSGILVTDGDFV
ncbi:alcohol dehydrogenase [Nitrospira sp.]|nr:alcohol dehydrogenase [Nitrospira sp.]